MCLPPGPPQLLLLPHTFTEVEAYTGLLLPGFVPTGGRAGDQEGPGQVPAWEGGSGGALTGPDVKSWHLT